MLKLLFCKVADVFDRDHQFMFSASVNISSNGEVRLTFPTTVSLEDMEIEGYVTFYDDVEGLVSYWCSFFNVHQLSGDELASMNLSVADKVDQVQRRQDLKTGVRFKIEIDYIDIKGKMRFCRGEVENISAGGVFFTSEHRFTLGEGVVLRLSEISPRLFTATHILRIQSLEDWASSAWLERPEEVIPPKPPAPEGQNIFSFVRKRKSAQTKQAASAEPETKSEVEPEVVDLNREVEDDVGGDTVRWGYGCQFRRIGEANEIAIRRFVFEQERLRLQSTRL